MDNSLENLKKELKLKLNEHTMFNNTLTEMMEKNSNRSSIEGIQNEIASLENDIMTLQEEIHIKSPKQSEKEEAKKSFYNQLNKPKLKKSIRFKKMNKEYKNVNKTNFYDSIEKNDFAPYNTPYNEIKKEESKKTVLERAADKTRRELYNDVVFANNTLKSNDMLISPYDKAISMNRFLVRFEGNVKVPEHYVRNVSFHPSNKKEICIRIFDFLTENNRPIITEFNNQNMPFRISIDHIDPTGVVLYTERYHGCNVMEIIKSDLDYNIDEKSTIELRITYSDVSYETAH